MLKQIACLLAIAAAISPGAASAGTKTLKIGYILAQESQLGAGATALAAEVAAKTGGSIKIEQQPNAMLGGEVDMLKGLQAGTVDMAFITGAPLPTIIPEAGIFSIPFIFRDAAHAHAVLDGAIGQAMLEKFKGKDMVALAWGENGLRHITNSKHPVSKPGDLAGLKMRLPQSEVMLAGFQAFGADAASLPFPKLYDALKTGQFDGQENPIATILASKFSQVQKHLTLSGHVYDPAVILISADVWGDLTEAEKAALSAAAKTGAEASRAFAASAQTKGAAELKAQGMEVVEKIDRDAFIAALKPARAGYEAKFGPDAIKAIESAK